MTFDQVAIGQHFTYKKNGSSFEGIKAGPNSWYVRKSGSTIEYEYSTRWDSAPRTILSIKGDEKSLTTGAKSMFKSIGTDLKSYLSANKDLIYGLVLVLLIDQYVFEGAFRNRIKAVVEGLLNKAESQAGIIPTTKVE